MPFVSELFETAIFSKREISEFVKMGFISSHGHPSHPVSNDKQVNDYMNGISII